jgi:hypothetical protein
LSSILKKSSGVVGVTGVTFSGFDWRNILGGVTKRQILEKISQSNEDFITPATPVTPVVLMYIKYRFIDIW